MDFNDLQTKINGWGSDIAGIAYSVGFWAFGILTVMDVIKHAKDRDWGGCIKAGLMGVAAYATLGLVKVGMEEVRDAFNIKK